MKVGEVPDLGGDGARQSVAVQEELVKVGDVSNLGGDGARQCVDLQLQAKQVGEVSDLWGDGARELVAGQSEVYKVGEVPDLRGDVSRELVSAQAEALKVREVPDFCGDVSRQLVAAQPEVFKVREVSDLGGDGAREFVGLQVKVSNVASLYCDSVPAFEGFHAGWYRGCVPSSAVCPSASVGCSVEGFEGVEDGFNLSAGGAACCRSYATEPCLELGVCWSAEPYVFVEKQPVHLRCSYQSLREFSR